MNVIRKIPSGIWIVGGILVVALVIILALLGPMIGGVFSENLSGFYSDIGGGSGGAPVNQQPPAAEQETINDGVVAAAPTPIVNENNPATGETVQATDRVILRNASLVIAVSDPEAAISEITGLATTYGGWVVSSQAHRSTDANGDPVVHGTVVIRVPAERLDEALSTIRSGAGEVRSENITGRDVTSDYVDLSSRLENLRASEAQLLTIMQRAETVEEVLAVQRELTTVRGQIEQIEGQLNFYDEADAYSSITVTVQPLAPNVVDAQRAGWNPGGTVERALGALLGIVQFLVDAAISLAIVFGPFVLVALPAWWLWRRRGQRAMVS